MAEIKKIFLKQLTKEASDRDFWDKVVRDYPIATAVITPFALQKPFDFITHRFGDLATNPEIPYSEYLLKELQKKYKDMSVTPFLADELDKIVKKMPIKVYHDQDEMYKKIPKIIRNIILRNHQGPHYHAGLKSIFIPEIRKYVSPSAYAHEIGHAIDFGMLAPKNGGPTNTLKKILSGIGRASTSRINPLIALAGVAAAPSLPEKYRLLDKSYFDNLLDTSSIMAAVGAPIVLRDEIAASRIADRLIRSASKRIGQAGKYKPWLTLGPAIGNYASKMLGMITVPQILKHLLGTDYETLK